MTLIPLGWVESAPNFVGFRCTPPNLHVTGVIAKNETQQWLISKPSLKSFFTLFDQTGCLLASGPGSYETENLAPFQQF
jgi:hypothetical protein